MKPELKSKLNLSVIIDPRAVGRDVVTGTLPGDEKLEIIVTRRLKGWTPLLRITVAGHVIHWAEPSEFERQEFNELYERARSARFRDREQQLEERFLRAAEAAKLWLPDSLI